MRRAARIARTVAGLLLSLAAAGAYVGCTRGGGGTPGSAHVLRIAFAADPGSLVPLVAIDQEIIAFDTLFCQPLIGLDAANGPIPILVTRIPSRENGDVSPDGTRITYHLRRGVRFADGVEFTSDDVAFTYHAIFDPRNRATSVEPYRRIAALQTPDPYTVVIRLRAPWNAAVRVLFAEADYVYGILPKHAFADTKVVGTRWEDAPFGTGPFRVQRWLRGDRIILEPNAYFRPRPKLTQIVFQIVANLDANFAVLRTRAVDVGTLTAENVEQAQQMPNLRVLRIPENATGLLYLQTQIAPTNDVRVRRAIAAALDYSALASAWLHQFPQATSVLPPPIVTWKGVAIPPYRHDVAAAQALLDSAGWRSTEDGRRRNGEPLAALIGVNAQNPIAVRIATLVQSQLSAVGIHATIKTDQDRVWFTPEGLLRNGKATMVSEVWVGGGDPEQSLNLRCVQAVKGDANHSFYCSKPFEKLFDDQSHATSQSQRERDLDAIQVLVHNDAPVIPLYYEERLLGVSRRVTGYNLNMLWIPIAPETWDVHS